MTTDRERVRLVVTGRVQGVWYRASLQREARRLQVAGWVRNRHDGAVEAEVEGAPDAIAELVAWARLGPAGAEVSDVTVTPLGAGTTGGGAFVIRH
jgi:acylphosphatase